MQVFFSKHCPLIQWDLPLLQKVLYTNGTFAYFCTVLSTFIYTAVPMVSLVWGVHPVTLNRQFALAATLYFVAGGTDPLLEAGSIIDSLEYKKSISRNLDVAGSLRQGNTGSVRPLVRPALGSTAGGRRRAKRGVLYCWLAGGVVNFSVYKFAHLQGMFLSLTSNYLLAFTYLKAILNTWL